jgi:hypothetical protein
MKRQAQKDPSFISTSLWALAIVAGVAVAVTAGWQLAGPAELKRQLTQAGNDLRTTQAEVTRLKKELALKPAFSSPENFPPAQQSVVASSSHAGEKHPTPAAPASAEDLGKSLRKMLEAPGMKAAMKQQQAFQIVQRYGHLFDVFSLNDQEKQAFNQLLDDRISAQSDLGLKMMDTSLTPEQRQQAMTAYQTSKQASDAAIKNFLNSDADYQTFQQWEDTSPERMQMQFMGDSLFASSAEPLTPQQEQQLIDTMYQTRKQSGPAAGQDPSNPASFDPSNFTDEQLQKTLQMLDANAQTVAQNAKSFLTPGQLQTLANMQGQIRSMTESSMKMAQTMFGGKSP